MNARILKIFLFALLITMGSCTKNEFYLIFEFPEDINSTYKAAYYASNAGGGMEVETAAVITKGRGELKCVTYNPSTVWLFTAQQQLPSIIIYAERGDKIKISGLNSNPLEWTVKGGGKVNDLLTEWRVKNKDILRDAIMNFIRNDDKYGKALNKSVAEFVTAHPESAASALLLTAYYDSSIDGKEYQKLIKMLDESGVSEKYTALMARQDLLNTINDESASVSMKDIIVQSYLKNYDTLKLKSSPAPTFLYIWAPNDFNKETAMDSLRRLAKWRKDSASMIIADITIGNDSASWSFSCKRDSLRHTLRAIALRGFADRNMMDLSVRKTPWYIVTSGKGKMIYSGQNLEEAVKKFKKEKR